ncbi:MAG: hypothetical protein KDA59_05440 [Planctomycetales bacterium]|nr:hypothetical protein [Planctomycetales bacterium]MCA9227665.1 hypothetical protein [Planctomycetales bacterium]
MSDSPESAAPFDPYSPPRVEASPATESLKRPSRPGWLTALSIITIMLGGLGLASAVMGIVTTIAAPYLQNAMQPPANAQIDPMTQLQLDMNRAQYTLLAKLFWPLIGFGIGHVLVAGLLLTGGVMSLMKKPFGRTLLVATFLLAILFELCRSYLTGVQMMETYEIMNEYMGQMAGAMPGPAPPGMGQMMTTMSKVIVIFQAVVAGIWLLVKLVFYATSYVYLRRPDIRQHFDGPQPAV